MTAVDVAVPLFCASARKFVPVTLVIRLTSSFVIRCSCDVNQ